MKKYQYSLLALAIGAASLSTSQAQAAEINFSGFLNVVGERHDADGLRYLEVVEDDFRFERSDFGLNVAAQLSDKISVAAQMIGGGREGQSMILDWGFISYQTSDESKFKLGVIKNPGNLYSETVDVGFLYPWIHAPESIYSGQAELFFETYEGAGFVYEGGDDIEFYFEAYTGSTAAEDGDGIEEDHDQLFGLAFSATSEMGQIKLGYNTSIITSINTDLSLPVAGRDGKRYSIFSLGVESEFEAFQFIAELSSSSLEDASSQDRFGWYTTLAYSFDQWKPHVTYQDFSIDDGSVEQSSITFGLNRQMSSNMVIKFEVKRVSDIIGNGFFDDDRLGVAFVPNGGSATIFGIAANVVF